MFDKLHHVAYRCRDASETVAFYTNVLGLRFAHAIAAERVPSTQEFYPHLHIFFEMKDGSYIAFFELPASPPAAGDANTPDWVQHLALEVESQTALLVGKERLQQHNIPVIGPIDHGFVQSIYFFDPSGHRLEMTYRVPEEEHPDDFAAQAPAILQDWEERKRRQVWTSAQP